MLNQEFFSTMITKFLLLYPPRSEIRVVFMNDFLKVLMRSQ